VRLFLERTIHPPQVRHLDPTPKQQASIVWFLSELYVIGFRLSAFGPFGFLLLVVIIYRSHLPQLYVSFNDLEEHYLDEEDYEYEYTEELRDDHATGATSHPTSRILLGMQCRC
jgi:hypothetical protein